MSNGAMILTDIYRKHMYAAQDKDEGRRARLFRLIEDFEWAYPEVKAEVDALYPKS